MRIWDQFVGYFADGLQAIAEAVGFLGGHKWAAAIVLLTMAVRTVLIPLMVKQFRSQRAMMRLQPEMKRLQQKHKKDKERLNKEMMELYQREGVNPLGGCLPLVAQGPVLIAMFYAIRNLAQDPDVGAMPFLGLGDLTEAAISSAGGILLIVIMLAAQFFQTRQMMSSREGGGTQQKIMQYMPFFIVIFFINFPAGLVLYWTTSTLFQVAQQTILLRTQELPEPPKGGKAKGGKTAAGKGKGSKSKKNKKKR